MEGVQVVGNSQCSVAFCEQYSLQVSLEHAHAAEFDSSPPFYQLVVQARDTDILVLLLAHFHRFQCKNLWIKAGTAKKTKIHTSS